MKKLTVEQLDRIRSRSVFKESRADQAAKLIRTFFESGYEAVEVEQSDFKPELEFTNERVHYFQGILMNTLKTMRLDYTVVAVTSNGKLYMRRLDIEKSA